jgi:peptidoglycan/LPS O-acetylase OafA/YrhL
MQPKRIWNLFAQSDSAKSVLSRNSFGLIRLILASAVVLHHSLVLSGHPSSRIFGGFDLGTVAVAGFFAASGFLLLGSSRRLGTRSFLKRRFFRLFPGLWVCLIICAFLMVPFANYFSTYESTMSFLSLESSSLTFVLSNSTSIVLQDAIGTVFSQNQFPDAINGSLWTLAPEFICYLGILTVAVLARRNLGIQFVLIMFALIASCMAWVFTFESNLYVYSKIVNPACGVAVAFCTGSMLAIVIEYKSFRPRVFIPIIGLAIWAIVGVAGPISII